MKKTGGSIKIDKKVLKEADALMKELLDKLEISADVSVSSGSYSNAESEEEEFVDVVIEGEDIGVLIGYLGRNLRALQKISGLLLNHRLGLDMEKGDFVRFVIDVSGYREKRQTSLYRMADKVRDEVLASGESVELPPMSSYERHMIHTHLAEYDDVTTESFGDGGRRYVRVFPVGESGEKFEEKGDGPSQTSEKEPAKDDEFGDILDDDLTDMDKVDDDKPETGNEKDE